MKLWDKRLDFHRIEPILMDLCEGSKVLTHRPLALHYVAAWFPRLTSLSSILDAFMNHLP